jgi:hypothetical protein
MKANDKHMISAEYVTKEASEQEYLRLYFFKFDGKKWECNSFIEYDDYNYQNILFSLALEGDIAAVGSISANYVEMDNRIDVFKFCKSSNSWLFDQRIERPDNKYEYQELGISIELLNEKLLAYNYRPSLGYTIAVLTKNAKGVYKFSEKKDLHPEFLKLPGCFGWSMDTDGTRLLIGDFHDNDFDPAGGAAYVYTPKK